MPRVFCDVEGRRYLPGVCWYPAKRALFRYIMGLWAQIKVAPRIVFVLFALDRSYISAEGVFVCSFGRNAKGVFSLQGVIIMFILAKRWRG